MDNSSQRKPQLTMIAIITACMIAAILVVGSLISLIEGKGVEQSKVPQTLGHGEYLPQEAGMYKGLLNFARFGKFSVPGANERTLEKVYSRRMFAGAPPQIPHPVHADFAAEKTECLSCHTKGGYVKLFNAYTPVTPHPHFLNCRQCHVPKQSDSLFKQTNWASIAPPQIQQKQFEGGPPFIPHELQMRENCLSCHGGPSAAKEIRTTHPERVNCRQCHLQKTSDEVFISSFGINPKQEGQK
jgi:cytochrome c-type protein NapB